MPYVWSAESRTKFEQAIELLISYASFRKITPKVKAGQDSMPSECLRNRLSDCPHQDLKQDDEYRYAY